LSVNTSRYVRTVGSGSFRYIQKIEIDVRKAGYCFIFGNKRNGFDKIQPPLRGFGVAPAALINN
jgi:hypothetical protein